MLREIVVLGAIVPPILDDPTRKRAVHGVHVILAGLLVVPALTLAQATAPGVRGFGIARLKYGGGG